MKKILPVVMLILCFAVNGYADGSSFYRGELKGAKIYVAAPEEWNHYLLILAHGGAEGRQSLSGDFNPEQKLYKSLIDNGWMVASTSYRRLNINDAIEDIGFLREYIVNTYGTPEQTYIDGHSMGGLIGTLIAERYDGQYTGMMLIDPALSDRFISLFKPNYCPKVPILYLCNQDEVAATQAYLDKLNKESVFPALWIVKRDGHVNVNDDEELMAIRAVVDYANRKPIDMKKDLLIIPEDNPSVAVFKDGGVYSKVIRIHPKWGNIDTTLIPADVEKLGIHPGDTFTVRFGDNAYTVLLGTTFRDVPRGEWIAFFKEDGRLKIARNFDSAVKLLGCQTGDEIFIRK